MGFRRGIHQTKGRRVTKYRLPKIKSTKAVSLLALLGLLVAQALIFGVAIAPADEPSEPFYEVAPSAAEEGATTEEEIASQLTDQQAATQLPHQNLDRGEALQLLKSVFETQLETPAGPFNDLQVEKFLSDNVAVVSSATEVSQPGVEITGAKEDDPYTGPVLVESSVPMRTEDEEGKEEAVDLGLEHDEGELQSENPLVEIGIPQEIGKGVELGDSEVQLELPSAPEQVAPSVVDESVAFYPNVATDTDLAIAPTPEGVETMTQIRSAAAPLSQTFHLDLPAGAELQSTSIGGAEVKSGDATLVNISPAGAIDASGKAIPTEMKVSGNALTLSVSPEEGTSYPILLDPVYNPGYSFPEGKDSAAGTIGKDWISGKNTNALVPQAVGFGKAGLEVAAFTGSTLASNDQANWFYHVPRLATDITNKVGPPTSWIASMTIRNLLMSTAGGSSTPDKNYSPYLVSGIWDETALAFQAAYMHGGSEPDLSDPGITYNFYTGVDPNAKAALGVALLSNGSHQMISNREVYAGLVILSIADEDLPEIAPIQRVPGWVGQTATTPFKVTASDSGLGISRIFAEQTNSDGSVTAGAESLECTGSASNYCPRSNAFTPKEMGPVIKDGPAAYALGYNPSKLPQGINYIKFSAEDIVGNKTSQPTLGQVRVDHTAPELSLSGSMTEQAIYGTRQSSYTLKVSGTDGTSQTPQAGIASAEVKLDGQKVKMEGKQLTEWSPACTTENCPLSAQWTLIATGLSAGLHTVEVTATDAAGNTSSPKKITVEIHSATPPTLTLGGSATEQATLGASRPRYILKANASALAGTDGSAPYEIAYSSSFGSGPNSGNGQFNHPADVVTDAQGNRWVADKANNRVEEFNEKGEFIKAIGSLGSTGGKLNAPSGVAIDSYGDIDVTDTGNNRVARFHEDGTFDSVVGANVNKTKVESKGTLAEKNHCTASSGNVCQAGTAGSTEGLMSEPIGITTSGGGNFFVVEKANNRVEKFNPNGELLAKFGSSGTGEGQFKEPTAMITAPNGEGFLWVADTGNNRVEEFNSSYAFVRAVGKEGSGNGEFKAPDAIGADAIGDVYVADRGNSRVEEFNEKGTYLAKFGSAGTGPGQFSFSDPAGIVVTGKGEVLITDSGNNRVQTWIAPKLPTYSSSFGAAGTAAGQFNHPADVAIDAQGNLWTVDRANNRIEEFTESGGSPKAFGSLGSTGGKLSSPSAIAIDPSGNVWVSDTGNNRVEEFNNKGEFVATFGSAVNKTKEEAFGTQAEKNLCTAASKNVCQAGTAGPAESQMNGPVGIAVAPDGNLLVVDKGNNRFKKYSPTGAYLAIYGSSGTGLAQFKEPTAITVAPDGSTWVADSGNNRIQHWSSNFLAVTMYGKEGTANGEFKHPDAIETDPFGDVFVADQGNGRVQQFDENGTFLTGFGSSGTGTGQFSLTDPAGIAVNGKGEIWLTDTGNNRIEKWTQQILRSQISTKITVDGKQVSTGKATCIGASCPLASEWILESAEKEVGKHTIEVEATDGLGRSVVKTMTIEIQRDTTKPTLSSSGPLVNAPDGWVEQEAYALSASAKDGGYGATSLNLMIDGKVAATSAKPCPDGGCEISLSSSVNMNSYPGGAHPAELIAKDGAGNQMVQKWTINVNPDGKISTEEATDTLEALDETAETTVLTPNTPAEIAEGNNPGISGLKSTGTGAPSEIGEHATEGYTLITPYEGEAHEGGELQVVPTTVSPSAGTVVVSEGIAGVATNTQGGVDSIVRPIYDGIMGFDAIRESSSPSEYSWEVQLDSDQKIVSLDSKSAQVVYSDGTAVAMIKAMEAHDATGKEVPTKLKVEGKIITLIVEHKGGGFVYPILAGHSFEIGYGRVEIVLPPPPPGTANPDYEWTGYEGISPPEPIDGSDAEASASGFKGVKKHFLYVECSHNHLIYRPPESSAAGIYREQCGNPFQNDPGEDIAFRAAMHGKYFINEGVKVWHEGSATEGIGCMADHAPDGLTSYQKRTDINQCVWWGKTKDGGGASAPYGKHITPVGQFTTLERGSCGDNCPGPNPWVPHEMPPMAFYLWASGHVGFHETTCIDC